MVPSAITQVARIVAPAGPLRASVAAGCHTSDRNRASVSGPACPRGAQRRRRGRCSRTAPCVLYAVPGGDAMLENALAKHHTSCAG